MNCVAFEALAGDLVRDRLPIGGERDLAFTHAEKCPRCALRLVDERALAADLRTLALGTEGAEAPLRVEEALLSAWREVRIEPMGAGAPRSPSGRSTWLWVAAAALLLSAGGLVLRGTGKAAPSMTAAAGTALPAPDEVPTAAVRPSTPAPGRAAKPTATAPLAPATRRAGSDSRRGASVAFASLDGTGSVDGLESAHVVRVELPPSALAALGWPVADDGETSLVRADVVVAEDGVARAIRLVE
jgi:hypothetical protein